MGSKMKNTVNYNGKQRNKNEKKFCKCTDEP